MPSPSSSETDAASLPPQLVRDVAGFVAAKGLIKDGDRVLCLVSGGADSVMLLRALNQLSRTESSMFDARFLVAACHVNYGRRGADSDGDEDFVRRLGDRLGAPVHAVRAPRHDGSNFQSWARDFRYLAAENLCRSHDYTKIAVGHNKDDRVETFIYRLITYSGRRSLVAMPARRGRVIRPLLFLESDRIRELCRRHGIEYREDASNRALDYARNRIRQLVLPPLQDIRPDFRDRILETLALLEDEDAVLRQASESAWSKVAADEDGGDGTVLSAAAMAALPRATARLLVRRWLAESGSRALVSRRLIDNIIELCQSTNGSRSLTLPGGLRVDRKYDKLSLAAAPSGAQPAPAPADPAAPDEKMIASKLAAQPVSSGGSATGGVCEEAILPVPGAATFGDFEIEAVASPWWGVLSADPLLVTIDGSRLQAELRLRRWRAGDRFTPLGLKGRKSLQDLFVDAKIPRSERARIPVVVSGDEIVWVCGLRISEDFRVTSRSERLIGLKATRRIVDNKI